MENNTNRPTERTQKAADACIALAQYLEAEARNLKHSAKCYRDGSLMIHYTALPADAGAHVRHPAARVLELLNGVEWTVRADVARISAHLAKETI